MKWLGADNRSQQSSAKAVAVLKRCEWGSKSDCLTLIKYDLVFLTSYSMPFFISRIKWVNKTTSKKEITKTIFDSGNHTCSPKEDHLPDWARWDNQVNPLNAELNPNCKSQLAEFFCGVFKFCAWYSQYLNISGTKQDKFVKQKAFCGKGNRYCSVCLQML